jgi:hypothetical protein
VGARTFRQSGWAVSHGLAAHRARIHNRKCIRGFGQPTVTVIGIFFDPQSANGRVHFVPRGADAKATIYEDDMIDNGEPI